MCDVRPNDENPVADYRRKLKPTQVIVLEKEDNSLYFVKPRKDGKPSKTTVSITGPVLMLFLSMCLKRNGRLRSIIKES